MWYEIDEASGLGLKARQCLVQGVQERGLQVPWLALIDELGKKQDLSGQIHQ